MALSINPIGTANSPAPSEPSVYSGNYRHSIVDSVYQNENSILSLVPGTPVLVWYYRQAQKSSEEQHAYQPGSGAYQQYTLIKDCIIKEKDYTFNFNEETGISTKTGSGYVITGLAPLLGDTFIADIGDGNAGFFTITEKPRITEFTANKVYEIQYTMQGIVTPEIAAELQSFVIEDLVYVRDQHLNGGTPVITAGEYELKKEIESWIKTIVHYVYEEFYWEEERTLAVMKDRAHYYDPYLTLAFLTMAKMDARGGYPRCQTHSLEYGGNKSAQHGTFNIWDVMFRGDWNMLPRCKPQSAIVDVKRLYSTRLYGNIRSTAFDGVIVTDPENYLDMSEWISWRDVIPNYNVLPNIEQGYLFSEDFYKGKPQGEFENLVVDNLKNNIVDLKRLAAYLKTYWDLAHWEQLYYAPILLLMIDRSRKMGKVI